MILTLFVGAVIGYLIYSWMTIKPKNFPPGPPAYPLIGSLHIGLKSNLPDIVQQYRKKYGGIIGFVFPGVLSYFVADPKLIMECFKREEFMGRFHSKTMSKIMTSRGIFLNDSAEWSLLRRLTLRNLRDYKLNSERVIEQEYFNWRDHTFKQGDIISVHNLFSVSSLNAIWSSVCGSTKRYDDPEFLKLIKTIYDHMRYGTAIGFVSDLLPWLIKAFPKLTGYDAFKERLDFCREYIKKEIRLHQQTLDPENPRDLMDTFIMEINEGNLTENQLIAVVFDLLIAGGESISNTLSFGLLYMVLYPKVQKKVQEEIDRVIGTNQISVADRQSLPYVEATLTESKRSNPIAPTAVPRRATQDTTLGGYDIKQDSIVTINFWSIFQDKEIWGDPENFRPERFIDSKGEYVRDERLAFFGLGKRVCLGESMARKMDFIFFVKILQEFNLSLPDGDPKPSTIPKSGFTNAPEPFRIKFTKRKQILI